MICQHCGATIPENSHFCIYCGVSLEEGAVSPVPQPTYRTKLDLAKLLGDTFTLYGRHFGTMCMVGLILVGVSTFFGVCGALMKENIPLTFLIALLTILATFYVAIMGFRQCLYTARCGADFQPNLVFPPLLMYLKILGLDIVTCCIYMGFFIVLGLPLIIIFVIVAFPVFPAIHAANVPPVIAGLIGGIVGGCIAGVAMIYPIVKLWMTSYFLVDRNMGVFDSVKTSWQVAAGNFWTLCFAIIVFFGCLFCWNIPCAVVSHFVWGANSVQGVLLTGIGGIFLVPIVYLGGALAYLQLTGEPHYLDRERAVPQIVNETTPLCKHSLGRLQERCILD